MRGFQSEGSATAFDIAADGFAGRCCLRDSIVLDYEQDGEPPDGGEVHALIEQALAQRAVADDNGSDPVFSSHAPRQRLADADSRHPALNAIGMKIPEGQMLAAANAA